MAQVEKRELPDRVKQIYEKGNAAMERGKDDFAINMFLRALELEPRFLAARDRIRKLEVKKALEKKGKISLNTIGMGAGGIKKHIKKDPQRAVQEGENLLRRDVANVQVLLAYADATEAAEIPEAGAQAIELTRELHPDKNEPLLERLARLYRAMGDHSKEREVWTELCSKHPGNQEYIKEMKNAAANDTITSQRYDEAVETGDFRKAVKDLEEAQRLEQENKGRSSKSDLERRVARLIKEIEAEPDNLNNYKQLGDSYAKLEEYEEARNVYETASELVGGADPELERAISSMNVKIYEANIDHYESEGDEENAAAMRSDLQAYLIHDAAECVERYPNDNQYKFAYGKLLFEEGQIDTAIPLFQKSRNHPKVRFEALHYLALCYEGKGIFEIAAETLREPLEEMIQMTEQKKDMLYDLGLIYEKMGQPTEAKNCFKKIYMVDYEYKDVAVRIEGRGAEIAQ